jgi:hypothetical protein
MGHTNGNKSAASPNEPVLFNGTNRFLKKRHIRLIIPRLDIKSDDRLGNSLGLGGLLLRISLQSLLLDSLGFSVGLFVVTAKEIDVVVIFFCGGWGSSFSCDGGLGMDGRDIVCRRFGAVAGEGRVL